MATKVDHELIAIHLCRPKCALICSWWSRQYYDYTLHGNSYKMVH